MEKTKQFQYANIPEKFWNKTLDDFDRDENAVEIVEEYINDLADNRTAGRGLLLAGEAGLGKTLLACCILKKSLAKGFKGCFCDAPHYLWMVRSLISLETMYLKSSDDDLFLEWKARRELLRNIRSSVDFFVLDDLGKEHLTSSNFAQDEIDYLLRSRGNNCLPTIITTNLVGSEWESVYSRVMESYIHEICEIVTVRGEDFRRL